MKNKKSIIVIAIFALLAVSVTASYAWFTGSIKGVGASVKTGKINLQFMSYKYDGATLTKYIDEKIGETSTGESLQLASKLQSTVAALSSVDDTDEVYFVVKKMAGSIPLDVQLDFELTGLLSEAVTQLQQESLTYAGGFWYNLQEITDQVDALTDQTLEDNIAAYASQLPEIPAAQRYNILRLSSLTGSNASDALRSGRYSVFRLTMGIDQNAANAVQYLDKEFVVNVSLSAAQEGGLLLPYGNAETYYVNNAEELNYYMGIYKPGDSIVISSDFDYYGDLVFPRPINLYLNNNGAGHILTVYGNLIFSYPYQDTYTVNTSCGGRIIVSKYVNAGGNFTIDTPNSSVTITGTNNSAAGKGDIYVQGNFTANVSCLPDQYIMSDSTMAGYGLTIARARILAGNGSAESNQNPKRIYLDDASSITISNDTTVGQIYAGSKSGDSIKQLVVVNYGTISQGIDLSSMIMDGTSGTARGRHIPQIFVDNYGTISPASAGSYSIALPNSAVVFDQAELCGNAWITRQMGAVDSGVSETGGFKNAHIYAPFDDIYVVDVDGDGSNLRVYYTSFKEEDDSLTLGDIMGRYRDSYNPDGNTENAHTQSLGQVHTLSIFTPGEKTLTAADYAWIKANMTNLVTLDMSCAEAAATSGSTVKLPADTFNGMSSLKNLSLPKNITSIGSNAFRNTGMNEITLPYSVTSVESSALAGISYVHVMNESSVITNLRGDKADRYLFVPASMLAGYRGTYTSYLPCTFIDATMHESGNFFYRIVSANRVQIAAYVGSAHSSESSVIGSFDFATLTLDGVDYSIAGFDDYSFYKKITQNGTNTKPEISLNFADCLSTIGANAFYGCTAINKALIITDDAYTCTIGDSAFYDCSYLDELSLKNVISIGNNAFYNCTNLIAAQGSKVRSMGTLAFGFCSKLMIASFPMTTIYGPNPFWSCGNLLVLENGVMTTNVSGSSFISANYRLRLWNIFTDTYSGDSVYMNHANDGCGSSKYRILVDNNLIPGKTSSFASLITKDRKKVTKARASEYIYYTETSGNVLRSSVTDRHQVVHTPVEFGYGDFVFELDADGNAKLLHSLAEKITGVYHFPAFITDSQGVSHLITEIDDDAFRYTAFENATIYFPDTLNTIGSYAFHGCSGIEHIYLGGTKWVKTYAFAGNNTLYSAEGLNVQRIDSYAFNEDSRLTLVRFPNWITSDGHVDGYIFYNCKSLKVAELGITTAGSRICNVFSYCSTLKMVIVLPKEVEGVGLSELYKYNALIQGRIKISPASYRKDGTPFASAYGDFYGLTGDVQPEDYKYFDETPATGNDVTRCSFEYDGEATNLSGIGYGDYLVVIENGEAKLVTCNLDEIRGNYTIPSTFTDSDGKEYPITSIGDSAFRSTNFNNATVTIPSSISSIGNRAFQDRSGISGLVFSNTPCTVGDYCFYACTGLKTVDCSGVTSLGSQAFVSCSSLLTVRGDMVRYIGYKAFESCSSLLAASFRNWSEISTSSDCYTFLNCKQLRVVETGVVNGYNYGCNLLSGCNNARMMIVNTQGHESAVPSNRFFTHGTAETTVKIIDNRSNTAGSVFAGSIGSYVSNSGSVQCSQYLYADDDSHVNDASVIRDSFSYGEEIRYLSGIGYGDYVIAPQGNNATILFCALLEINGSYTVPSSLTVGDNTYNITAIASSAYRSVKFTNATVSIPNGIVSVGADAFNGRNGIVAVNFPDTPCTLGTSAFASISTLGDIDLKGVTYLGYNCFQKCSSIGIAEGKNVETIEYRCFEECSGLMAARFPRTTSMSSASSGDSYAFRMCKNLRVLELGIVQGPTINANLLAETSNVKAIIIHGSGKQFSSFNNTVFTHGPAQNAVKLVDNSTVADGTTVESKLGSNAGSYGSFAPEDFMGVNDTVNSGISRCVVSKGGSDYSMTDLGYGDYIIAVNGTNATIIFCTLDKISGSYTVPSSFTVSGSTYNVTAIGGAAYMKTVFEDVDLVIPSSVSSIGNRAFNGRSGIKSISFSTTPCTVGYSAFSSVTSLTQLVLNGVYSLDSYAFSGCSSLQTVRGENVTAAMPRAFEGCTNLIVASLPRLTAVSAGTVTDLYLFNNCKYLKVIEVGVITSSGNGANVMNGVDSPTLTIVHTDGTTPTYVCEGFYTHKMPCYKLMDGCSFMADGTNIGSKLGSSYINTGDITADEYLYADDVNPANSVKQLSIYSSGTYKVLSDFGYGDYVFGIKNGKAYIVYCTLTEISGVYRLPDYFTVGGVSYPLGGIGINAFRSTKFTNVKLTIPASLETIGDSAFYDCPSVSEIHIENGLDVISAVNFFGNRKNMSAANLKVFVGELVYTAYTAESTWAGIPSACFVSSGIEFQPVAGGPVFHLDPTGFGGSYNLVYVSGLTTQTELTIPDAYTDGGHIVSISDIFFSNMGSGVPLKTLVLPAYLEEYRTDVENMPANMQEYIISGSNLSFSTAEGLLLSKDGSMLISMPRVASASALTLPEGIKVVASKAFTGVGNLESLIIPEGSTVVFGENAFVNCVNLAEIRFEGKEASWFTGYDTVVNCHPGLVIHVPQVSAELYASNVPLDSNVRRLMTAYDKSFAQPHVCSFGAISWYVSFDGRQGMGTHAIACRECTECHQMEYFHTDVASNGYAEVDTDGDGTADSSITFFPFIDPAPFTLQSATLPQPVSAAVPDDASDDSNQDGGDGGGSSEADTGDSEGADSDSSGDCAGSGSQNTNDNPEANNEAVQGVVPGNEPVQQSGNEPAQQSEENSSEPQAESNVKPEQSNNEMSSNDPVTSSEATE